MVQLVRYALNTVTTHPPVLPPLTDTLLVADKFRAAAIAIHQKVVDRPGQHHPCSLCGHEEDGEPCRGHQHAFFWPTDEDNNGFIDHVTVYCPRAFEQTEVDALRRLLRIRQRGGRPDLLVTPVFLGKVDEFEPWRGEARTFVSATPYFCPVHLSHGRSSGGKLRPITPQILKALIEQQLIASESEVEAIEELLFDYAPREFAGLRQALDAGQLAEPVIPRQCFPVNEQQTDSPSIGSGFNELDAIHTGSPSKERTLPADFPLLPRLSGLTDARFVGALIGDPDQPVAPFGVSAGLLVDRGTRFVRALSFCRKRRGATVKGRGRMLRITFRDPRRSRRPFAIGDQCHFGLGLLTPAVCVQDE